MALLRSFLRTCSRRFILLAAILSGGIALPVMVFSVIEWPRMIEVWRWTLFGIWMFSYATALYTTVYNRRTKIWIRGGYWRRLSRPTLEICVEAAAWGHSLDDALEESLNGVYDSPHASSEVT